MSFYEKKLLSCKALDVDTTKRQVKIAIANTGNLDHDGDIIAPEAALRTIKNNGPQGSNEIWHLLDHTPKSFSALSKFSEMGMYGTYIGGVSQYKNSFAWREVAWPLYESGDFTQHSIGFETIDSEQKTGYRLIKEVRIYEGSAVLWGANSQTPTLAVMKSLGIDPVKDDLVSKVERLIKGLNTGQYEDESHKSLIRIELQQIKQGISEIVKATGSDLNSTHSADDEVQAALSIFRTLKQV